MKKIIKNLIKDLEAQGWRVEPTTKGIMAFPPNPEFSPVTVHTTSSDHRWVSNAESTLRQRGFIGKIRR
jgi:hypothetical protein